MTDHDTQSLANLVAKKHECLAQLRDLGARQLELIDAGNLTDLVKVLSAKTHLISALQEIEDRLAPFHAQDPADRAWRSPEERALCADHAAKCQEILGEIVRQEKQSESHLSRRRDEVGVQLHDAHVAGQARGAYFAQSGAQTGMLDVTSHLGGTR